MKNQQKKPAMVLLHGFCEDKTLWNHIIPQLHFKGEIIALNLPGFGNTSLPSSATNLFNIAQIIKNQLELKGIRECICIGHSLGGYVALALKSKYPEFVTSIGLIHSTAFEDSTEKKNLRDKLVKFLNIHPPSTFLNTFAPSLFCESNISHLQKEIKQVINMSKNIAAKTIQQYAVAMRNRTDFTQLLFAEDAPLFIAGTCDNAIPVEYSESQIENIKNKNNCHLLKNVGHMGIYESPYLVIDAINKFT